MVRDKLTFCPPISVIIAKRQSRGGQYISDMAVAEQICATLTTELFYRQNNTFAIFYVKFLFNKMIT